MLSGFWNTLVKYLEKQPYWAAVQPFFLVLFAAVAAEVAAYQYVKAQYDLTLVPLFLGSYLSTRSCAIRGLADRHEHLDRG